MKRNQKGFSMLEVLLAFLALGIIGLIVWYVWHLSQVSRIITEASQPSSTPSSSPNSSGQSKASKPAEPVKKYRVSPTSAAMKNSRGTCLDSTMTLFAVIYNSGTYDYNCGVDPLHGGLSYAQVAFGQSDSSVLGTLNTDHASVQTTEITIAGGVKANKDVFTVMQPSGDGATTDSAVHYTLYEVEKGGTFFYAVHYGSTGSSGNDYYLKAFNDTVLHDWTIEN